MCRSCCPSHRVPAAVCEQWRPGRHRRLRKRPRCERTRVRACAQCDGCGCLFQKLEGGAGRWGTIICRNLSFPYYFCFIFEGDNVSPRAANSLRPENASFRVLYCRSGKKYIFTTGGVRLLVVARVFPVISEKDVTKHLGKFRVGFKMEMVRFGWEKGSRKLPYRAAHSLRPSKCIVPCTLLRVRKKISFYHLGCQTLVVARVS